MKSLLKKIVAGVLKFQARLILFRFRPIIVAVTGNVGKTSTKDAVFEGLATRFYARKSEKSFNSEIGVPLTIIGTKNAWTSVSGWFKVFAHGFEVLFFDKEYPELLVLEVGADRPGDIKSIAKWLKPHVVVITKFSDVPVHVEYFKNKDEIVAEKESIVKALRDGGTLVFNGDDKDCLAIAMRVKGRTIAYGTNGAVSHEKAHITYSKTGAPTGMGGAIKVSDVLYPFHIENVIGVHQVTPLLAAYAAAVALNVPLQPLASVFASYHPPRGRMNLIQGTRHTEIIDDSYNASPIAVSAALDTLKELKVPGRRIAVLGDMLELGALSIDAHKDIGKKVAEIADRLVTVGMRARYIADGAAGAKMKRAAIQECVDTKEAIEFLIKTIKPGDALLIKGSQSVRMERITKALMAEPDKAADLLPRQEPEWLAKP